MRQDERRTMVSKFTWVSDIRVLEGLRQKIIKLQKRSIKSSKGFNVKSYLNLIKSLVHKVINNPEPHAREIKNNSCALITNEISNSDPK